jgi:GNAT superfamily N-acetyltransferase
VEASRPATDADVPRLAALLTLAADELEPLRGGPILLGGRRLAGPAAETLAAALADPDVLVLAGTIDDFIVGVAVVRTTHLAEDRTLGVVETLYVEPEARAVGVGEALMNDVVAWCRRRGCVGIDAIALPGHRAAKSFFEESGFSARLIVMHHSL